MANSPHLEEMLNHIANSDPLTVYHDQAGNYPLHKPFDMHHLAADMAADEGNAALESSLRYMAEHGHYPSTPADPELGERGWTPASVFAPRGIPRPYGLHDDLFKHLPETDESSRFARSIYYSTPRAAHDAFHIAHAAAIAAGEKLE